MINKVGFWEILEYGRQFVGKYNYKTVNALCTKCGITKRWSYYSTLFKSRNKMCNICTRKYIPSKNKTHGMKEEPEYKTWSSIKRRCYKNTAREYPHYGGRGISMSKEWKDSFMSFYNDMGKREKGYSIERLNVDGNYCKENCIWIKRSDQNRNKRNTIFVDYNGNKECLGYICKQIGINIMNVYHRSKSKGISKQEAFDFYLAQKQCM